LLLPAAAPLLPLACLRLRGAPSSPSEMNSSDESTMKSGVAARRSFAAGALALALAGAGCGGFRWPNDSVLCFMARRSGDWLLLACLLFSDAIVGSRTTGSLPVSK
jgi:hypothetical protein